MGISDGAQTHEGITQTYQCIWGLGKRWGGNIVDQEVHMRLEDTVHLGYLYGQVEKSEANIDNTVGTEPS